MPSFGNPATYNYELAAGSSAQNLPNNPTTTGDAAKFQFDLKGILRSPPTDGLPDAGAYEK